MVLAACQLGRTKEYLVPEWNNPHKSNFVRLGTLCRIYKVVNNIININIKVRNKYWYETFIAFKFTRT